MSDDQLDDEALKLKKGAVQPALPARRSGQLQDTARVRVVRRDIARVKPSPRQKRRQTKD